MKEMEEKLKEFAIRVYRALLRTAALERKLSEKGIITKEEIDAEVARMREFLQAVHRRGGRISTQETEQLIKELWEG